MGGLFIILIKNKITNFYILILSLISFWVTVSTIYMTLPIYFKLVGLSTTEIGVLIALGTLSGAFSTIFLGWLSDRIGRKFLLVLALFSYSVCFLFFYFFQGFGYFVIFRLIEGVGAFSVPALATAIVADIFPTEKRGQAMGVYESVGGIGKTLGPLIAGLVLTMGSFSTYFIFCSLSVFISVFIVLILLKETLPQKKAHLVPAETQCLAEHDVKSSVTKTWKPLALFYSAVFLRSMGQSAVTPLLSLFFAERLGEISMIEMSILFCVPGFMNMVLSHIAGRVSDKTGRKKPFLVAILFFSIAPLLYIPCYSFMQALLIRFIEGATSSFVVPLTSAYLADLLTTTGQSGWSGTGFGVSQFLSTQTSTFGSVFGGYIIEAFGYNELFLAASTFSFASLLPLLKVPEPCAINKRLTA